MKKQTAIPGIFATLGMLVLILDSQTAILGSREGLELCLRTVIPSLFPFFVLSQLVNASLTGRTLSILHPLIKWTGIPEGGDSIFAVGLLGGYPLGAQCIASAHRDGCLSPEDARRMLAFCNNAGPAFLFGIASALFDSPCCGWLLWGIHIVSALLTAGCFPVTSPSTIRTSTCAMPSGTEALKNALFVMAQVCGWVMLFRVVIAFSTRWFGWLLPPIGQILLSGLLELSNGCCLIANISCPGLRFVLCSGFLSFGGLCVGMQTLSLTQDLDTSLYFPGKLLQTLYALGFSMLIQCFFPEDIHWPVPIWVPLLLLILPLSFKILKKATIRGRNPEAVGV